MLWEAEELVGALRVLPPGHAENPMLLNPVDACQGRLVATLQNASGLHFRRDGAAPAERLGPDEIGFAAAGSPTESDEAEQRLEADVGVLSGVGVWPETDAAASRQVGEHSLQFHPIHAYCF